MKLNKLFENYDMLYLSLQTPFEAYEERITITDVPNISDDKLTELFKLSLGDFVTEETREDGKPFWDIRPMDWDIPFIEIHQRNFSVVSNRTITWQQFINYIQTLLEEHKEPSDFDD